MNEVPTRLLRETLRGRTATTPSRECLDAATAAAWADDTLNRQERAAAEAHAADCARCQTLLAAMAKVTPPVAARSWWRMPAVGWLVPLTAAAAALIVWVNVPFRARSVSTVRATPAKTETVAAARVPSAALPPLSADEVRESKPDGRPVDQLAAAKASSGVGAGARPERAEVRRDAKQGAAREANVPAPAQANANALSDSAHGATAPPPAATPPAAPLKAATGPTLPARPVEKSAEPATEALAAPPQPAPAVGQRAAARMLFDVRRQPSPIVSTNPNSRWRIVDGGGVEHSIDGGLTWQAQSTGVTVTLTSGASPASTICWLVGPGGIVLLSTDGRSWQRIAFPEGTDLVSVRASGDKSATVTTADGRAFSTTDGGRSWLRAPRN
jgi:hypothetical protein